MRMLSGIQVIDCRPIAILQHENILAVAALVAFKESQDVRMNANREECRKLLLERAAPHAMEALDGHSPSTLCQARRLATTIAPNNSAKSFYRDLRRGRRKC